MKKQILSLLYENEGTYLSGQEISEKLGISRTAVWKHIKNLVREGYDIQSAHNRGYQLIRSQTVLLPEEIRQRLDTKWLGHSVVCLDRVDSTNQWAKRHIDELGNGSLIIAGEQTAGKGRMGRSWSSAKEAGIWMSLVLRPDLPMAEGAKMTQMAAAAMHAAITKVTGLTVQIKWPNDLLVNNKKVCGILTEMSGELTQIDYLVIGIGVNVNHEKFEGELKETATSLYMQQDSRVSRMDLLLAFMNHFEMLYDQFITENNYLPVLEIVRKYSSLLNKQVDVIRGNSRRPARALQIHEDGRLEVVYEDGSHELLSGGEVSVRNQ